MQMMIYEYSQANFPLKNLQEGYQSPKLKGKLLFSILLANELRESVHRCMRFTTGNLIVGMGGKHAETTAENALLPASLKLFTLVSTIY